MTAMDKLIEMVNDVADEIRRETNDNPADPWMVARRLAARVDKAEEKAKYWEAKAREYLSRISIEG